MAGDVKAGDVVTFYDMGVLRSLFVQTWREVLEDHVVECSLTVLVQPDDTLVGLDGDGRIWRIDRIRDDIVEVK